MKKSSKRAPKKVISMVLASSMIVSMSSQVAFAAEYSDVYGHWAKTQINRWSDYGVISGSDGQFRPDDSITRGEMAVIIDRVMKYQVKAENNFKDLGQAFYTDPILRANNAGVMSGSDDLVRPTDKITREEAAILMCKAFNLEPTDIATKTFSDSDKISSWARGYVNALLNENYITGKGNNDFDPQGKITRGEAVTMINNIVKGFYYATGTYTENAEGTVVVNTPNANLKDMNISGDLIIAEGVGEGDLTLDNVKVAGNVIVRGGGVNSIHIIGESKIGKVIIAKRDGNVSVKTSGGATVEFIYVEDGSNDVFLTGVFGNIEVNASNVTVTAKGATVTNANVNKPSSTLIVDKDSKVNVGTIAETAANSKIIVEGEVKNAIVNAPSATLTGEKGSKIDTVKVNESAVNAKVNLDGTTKSVSVAAEGTNVNVGKDGKVDSITVAKTANDSKVDVKGTVTTIKTDAPKTGVSVSGKVDKIEASETAKGTTITAEKGGNIKDIVSKAENTTVKGDGKVDKVQIGGNNSTVDTKGTRVEVGSGVNGTEAGGEDLGSGSSTTTSGTPDGGTTGGSGGSGSSGNGSTDNPNGNDTSGGSTEDTINVKSIELSKKQESVAAGRTFDISATISPKNASNRKIDWTTSDPSIATVEVLDNNGHEVRVTTHKEGTAILTATTRSGKLTASCVATVTPAELDSIKVTKLPAKTAYAIGESFDITGLEVTGMYSDGSPKIETITEADITGFDSTTAGVKVLTVTFNGRTATFNITVGAAALQSIAITTPPTKTIYLVGDKLDITGLKVTGTYSDGSIVDEPITEANITGFDSTTAGTKTLTVTVNEKTVTFDITVREAGNAAITKFGFVGHDVYATINGTAITIELPAGTNKTTLVAEFETSSGATVTVEGVDQESGVTEKDFTNPVEYVVTSQDGAETTTYTVTVTAADLDFTELNKAKAEADAKVKDEYTTASWALFETAKNTASAMPETTQAEIDEKTKAYQDAIKLLVKKGTQTAPTGLQGVATTTEGGSDGKITGTTTLMEYKKDGETVYKDATEGEITGLTKGTYLVRYKATDDLLASPDASIEVKDYVAPKYTYTLEDSKSIVGQKDFTVYLNGNKITGNFTLYKYLGTDYKGSNIGTDGVYTGAPGMFGIVNNEITYTFKAYIGEHLNGKPNADTEKKLVDLKTN